MEERGVISDKQHGIERGGSCVTNLIVFEEVTKEIDEGMVVDVVHIDPCKAFEKVLLAGLFKKIKM